MDGATTTIYTLANSTLLSQQQSQQVQQQIQQQSAITNSNQQQSTTTNNLQIMNQQQHTTSSLTVIEHLQQTLRQEQNCRIELEKELAAIKTKNQSLQQQLSEIKNVQHKSEELQRVQLDAIKHRLMISLKASIKEDLNRYRPTAIKTNNLLADDGDLATSTKTSPRCRQMMPTLSFVHECDECTFKTKSDVSLILHKMNHMINEQQYRLSTVSFNTNNPNSKSVYRCSACDQDQLTRHQVYRHIYDVHTMERPLSCPYCELSFTHKDYLDQHIPDKHENQPIPDRLTKTSSPSKLNSQQSSLNSFGNNQQDSASTIPSQITLSSNSSPSLETIATKSNPARSKDSLANKSGSRGGRSRSSLYYNNGTLSSSSSSKSSINSLASLSCTLTSTNSNPSNSTSNISNIELKCTFPDCNFVTVFRDKLDFHMKAHINTKYKCPYCPYVSNTIVDIKRHIQKSKKHEGMKMYSCQKCSFAADCDRQFKEHLRTYHFGYEAHDAVIDYFIEEMFSNKNKQRTDEEEATIEAQNAMALLLNSTIASTITANDNQNSPTNNQNSVNNRQSIGRPPPAKKMASNHNQNAAKQQPQHHHQQQSQHQQQAPRLINLENVVQLAPHGLQQQAHGHRPTAYRSTASSDRTSGGSATSSNTTQTSNSNSSPGPVNLHQPTSATTTAAATSQLSMYHNLELAVAAAAIQQQQQQQQQQNDQFNDQFKQQQQSQLTTIPISAVTMAHHHQQQQQQQGQQQIHPHSHLGHVMASHQQQPQQQQQLQSQHQPNESTLLAGMPEQFVQAALNQAAASLVVQQQQQQQQSGNNGPNNSANSNADGIPVTMTSQYVSYANY